MERISKYISYIEATKSNTAIKAGIDNTPNKIQLENMKRVGKIFDEVREFIGKPLIVSSFFRCDKLNKYLKGSKTSLHCSGCAIDIDSTDNIYNKQIFDYVKDNCEFTELINEFNYSWIHVGYNGNNDKEVLEAYKDLKGKTQYKTYIESKF